MARNLFIYFVLMSLAVATSAVTAEEFADHLAALGSKSEQKFEKAVACFAKQPLAPKKQRGVSEALNALDQDQIRQIAERAIRV